MKYPSQSLRAYVLKAHMQILADDYFLVCFAWLLAVRLKEYFHLPKAGFYLQQTLVNSGGEEQRQKNPDGPEG